MVYVEGAPKFMRAYKRLMLHRIQWTEAARPRGVDEVEVANDPDGDAPMDTAPEPTKDPEEEEEKPISLDDNTCRLVWEGTLRDRSFNTFKPKSCPTDGMAKELLGEKLRGYWDLAKNWRGEEEDLI